jgi:serine/threonine-protein phosphatase 2A activator
VRPRAIRTEEIVDSLADEYFYLACIKFINRVKTGSLVEHSPMLVDISGVRTWAKVNEGMIRMYRVRSPFFLPIIHWYYYFIIIVILFHCLFYSRRRRCWASIR